MEEVGVVPNEVSSSIHTQDYNHTIGTQKTHAMTIEQAEGEFHLYALEWTEDAITTYVDGRYSWLLPSNNWELVIINGLSIMLSIPF